VVAVSDDDAAARATRCARVFDTYTPGVIYALAPMEAA
jgi:hypothetical protein